MLFSNLEPIYQDKKNVSSDLYGSLGYDLKVSPNLWIRVLYAELWRVLG
jgi:hypothetical protein